MGDGGEAVSQGDRIGHLLCARKQQAGRKKKGCREVKRDSLKSGGRKENPGT